MRLLDNLRSAEQKGVNAVRQSMARAREEWGDVERRIRQRMRIYPQKLLKKRNVLAAHSDSALQPDVPIQVAPELETRKPIVSIHGRDVADDDFDHPAA